jgi:hypothetical protein
MNNEFPPLIETYSIGKCILCGSNDLIFYTSGLDYEMRSCANIWEFKKCANCEHLQLDPRPALSSMDVIYPKNYYSYTMSQKINKFILLGKSILDFNYKIFIRSNKKVFRYWLWRWAIFRNYL